MLPEYLAEDLHKRRVDLKKTQEWTGFDAQDIKTLPVREMIAERREKLCQIVSDPAPLRFEKRLGVTHNQLLIEIELLRGELE